MAQKRTAREAFGRPKGQLSAVAAAKSAKKDASVPLKPRTPEPEELATAVGAVEYDGHHDESSGPLDPVAEALPTPQVPTKTNVQLSSYRHWASALDFASDTEVTLDVDETVTAVGEYEVLVMQGIVTVYGAVLRPGSGRTRIYAPSTQALPQLQARQDGTKVRICTDKPSIRKLERLSPIYRNIWTPDRPSTSYTLLQSSSEDPLQRSLSPLDINQSTDVTLRTLSAKVMTEPRKPRIMAIGAKSSGKSTFNRVLCNHIQSWTPAAKCQYMDLDPGQPEFGPPGQVSLVEVSEPLLGPPFTHLADKGSSSYRMIRSHTIAATSFKHDPEHYRDCAVDLIRRADPNLPLVVNACGWVNGLGASVLIELVSLLQISDIVLLEPLEDEFVQPLQAAVSDATFHRIPRQAPKPASRTPAEQRAMQTMAYFHQRKSNRVPKYNSKPLSITRPYTVSYSGPHRGIVAVASYAQAPKPQFLAEVLDGSIVALVVLEPGHATSFTDAIARTPDNIPYLLPNSDGTTCTVDPKYSSCIGLALVRDIDVENSTLHLVTPLSEDEMSNLAEKDVVLVRGGFDSPEWAYLEDLYCNDKDEDEGLEERPWVSKREMVGVEGAVWRLRHPPMPSSMALSK